MLKRKIQRSGGIFDFDQLSLSLEELKKESTNPKFWNDNKLASRTLKKISQIWYTFQIIMAYSKWQIIGKKC